VAAHDEAPKLAVMVALPAWSAASHLPLGDRRKRQRALGQAQEELRLLKGTDRQRSAQPKRGDVAANPLVAVVQLLQGELHALQSNPPG